MRVKYPYTTPLYTIHGSLCFNYAHALVPSAHVAGKKMVTLMDKTWTYPSVRRDMSVKEVYCGTEVADPYRWLEDPDSEETQTFVKAQNEVTKPYLAGCQARDKFHAR